MPSVENFRAGLDEATLATVDLLRDVVAGAHPGLTERIKWNAPSFAAGGDDVITLGLERRGGVRVVLHRGARPRDLSGFDFVDVAGLAHWPSADRGVIVFSDRSAVVAAGAALEDLCARWVAYVMARRD